MAFTELGISMLSSVLPVTDAMEVNIAVMRTFVRLQQLLATHGDLGSAPAKPRLKQISNVEAEHHACVSLVPECKTTFESRPRRLQQVCLFSRYHLVFSSVCITAAWAVRPLLSPSRMRSS